MPNAFFRAKLLWKTGEREAGFLLLNDYLKNNLGQPVFQLSSQLLQTSWLEQFENAVMVMLIDYRISTTPFSQVFSLIWDLDPSQRWIDFLLGRDLREDSNPEILANALISKASKGLLGPSPTERPNGGRAVLPIEEVRQVEFWGKLRVILLDRLPEAYSSCSKNFWAQLATQESEAVVIRFLHDLFVHFSHPIDVAETRWKVIVRDHRDYANAVLIALETLLNSTKDTDWLTEIVHIDAGFTFVSDGSTWLRILFSALEQQDFARLATVTS